MVKRNGFTFYELLLVLAIIAIISVIIIPKITDSLMIARSKALTNDINIILSTLKTYCNIQESKLVEDCDLNSIIEYQKNNNIKNETLAKIINGEINDYLNVRINLKEDSWLTISGYGTISIWYPFEKENNECFNKYGVKISSLDLKLFSSNEFNDYINNGNIADIAFIYDVNNNSQIDDDEDILIYCSFFKLNDSHNHNE